MDKVKKIAEMIRAVKVSGRFVNESKNALIEFYCVQQKDKLDKLDIDKIITHNFKDEVATGALRLRKKAEIKKKVSKLERHAYAPELNKLHFKSGKTFPVRGITELEDALTYASIHMDSPQISLI
jgi:hypothetical protein